MLFASCSRMCVQVLLLVFMTSIGTLEAQEGAQYLQTAITELKNLNSFQNNRRVDPSTQVAPVEAKKRQISRSDVPPLSITKGELAALYEAAVSKGKTVKINHGEGPHIHAAVHELEDHPSWTHEHEEDVEEPHHDDGSGYYYYYYPLKSFIDELSSQPSSDVSTVILSL